MGTPHPSPLPRTRRPPPWRMRRGHGFLIPDSRFTIGRSPHGTSRKTGSETRTYPGTPSRSVAAPVTAPTAPLGTGPEPQKTFNLPQPHPASRQRLGLRRPDASLRPQRQSHDRSRSSPIRSRSPGSVRRLAPLAPLFVDPPLQERRRTFATGDRKARKNAPESNRRTVRDRGHNTVRYGSNGAVPASGGGSTRTIRP